MSTLAKPSEDQPQPKGLDKAEQQLLAAIERTLNAQNAAKPGPSK